MRLFKNKIIKNFSILTGTNILSQVLSIFSSIRLARQLQPEGFGVYNFIAVQASIFSIVACYGLRVVIIRQIARNNNDARKVFVLSCHIRLVTTSLAIILLFFYNLAYGQESLSAQLVIAVMALIVFQTSWDTIESIFFGFEKMETSGIINLIFTSIWIAEIYFIPNNQFTVETLISAFLINQGLKSLLFYFWLHKRILKKLPSTTFTKYAEHVDIIKQSNFYFVLAIFSSFQNQMPILLLQFNSTIDQIGLFNLGNRILSPFQMMLNLLLTSLFPMLSRLAIDNKPLFAIRVKSLMNIIIFSGILGSILFALFSKDVVHLLYGEAYKTSANVILIQCWFTVLFAIFCAIGSVLSALDKQKLLSQLSIIYSLTALPIFFIGTKYGAVGLAWSFVIAAFINMTYHWVIFRNLLENNISIVYSVSIFSCMAILSFYTGIYEINIPFFMRVCLTMVLSILFIYYILKVEYKNMLNNNFAKVEENTTI
jgi:O-antigen/teichoic acid export membrane protein